MSLQKIRDMKREYDKTVKAEGRDLFLAELKEVFASFPRLEALRWEQYTPHFNDGDVCKFGTGEVLFKVSGHEVYSAKYTPSYYDQAMRRYVYGEPTGEFEETPEQGDDGDGFLDSYQFNPVAESRRQVNPITSSEYDMLDGLERLISGNKDIVEAIFGDGYQITIHRDGTVETEAIDHD